MLGVLDQVPEQEQVQQVQEELLVVCRSQQPNRQCQFPTVGSLIQSKMQCLHANGNFQFMNQIACNGMLHGLSQSR